MVSPEGNLTHYEGTLRVCDAKGKIVEPLEFVVHAAETAPAGMAGITDPFWITGINKRTTDPLA